MTKIEEDVTKVIQYSQGIEEPKIKELLANWKTNKADFIQRLFAGSPIYQVPEKLSFELDEKSKKEKFDVFKDYVYDLCSDFSLDRYLCTISHKEFFQNTLAKDKELPNGKTVKKGMKFLRTLRFFIEDEKLLADIQNFASEIMQENKIEGYLCFSVHPLDFLSSSENTLNWRSCHSLDGEYRAGNLSYMQDECTIMAYLRTDKDVKLPNFPEDVPWNNKKWRCLLFFNENRSLIFAGRQYPFSAKSVLNRVNKELGKLLSHTKWSNWKDLYIETYEDPNDKELIYFNEAEYIPINGSIYKKSELVKDAANSRHFNDLLHSCCYTHPYYMYNKYSMLRPTLGMTIGSEVKCLWCGENLIDGPDSMMCHKCECEHGNSDSDEYRTCGCCGRRVWIEECCWVDDYCICPDCAETETFVCEQCGERYFNSERHYDKEKQEFLCSYCL